MGTIFPTGRTINQDALDKLTQKASNPDLKGLTTERNIRTTSSLTQLIKSGKGSIFTVAYDISYNDNASPPLLRIFDNTAASGTVLLHVQPNHAAGGGDPLILSNSVSLNTSVANGIFLQLVLTGTSDASITLTFS